jgi:hypothetical protein
MKKQLILSIVLWTGITAMAQTLVVEDKNGNRTPYDIKQVSSVDIQTTPAGFTVHLQGKYEKYEFANVKGISASPSITENEEKGTDLLVFYLLDNKGNRIDPFMVEDSLIHMKIPNNLDLDSLTLIYKHNGQSILIDSVECLSESVSIDVSDFTKAKTIRVVSPEGKSHTWKLLLYDLPVIVLNTPNSVPIESKEERVEDCDIKMVDSTGVLSYLGKAGVRGRGHSTWKYPKKPYNIKFESKVAIPGFNNNSKHWLLLSNPYYDRSQLHNAVAFEMARMTDYPWVQSGVFVELILNGEHRGLYYLCEKIGEEKGKIDLKEKEGDFLLESLYNRKENYDESQLGEEFFTSSYFTETGLDNLIGVVSWEVKFPEDISSEVVANIKKQLEEIEELMYDDEKLLGGSCRQKFDIETAINWLLVEEVALNDEASRSKNIYIYKEGNMLYFGPPWDFDARTFGLNGTKKWSVKNSAVYFPQLFKDPVFITRFKEKWDIYKSLWKEHIPDYINQQYKKIHKSAERNEQMWSEWHYLNKFGKITYKELIENMIKSFKLQIEWMDGEIRKM